MYQNTPFFIKCKIPLLNRVITILFANTILWFITYIYKYFSPTPPPLSPYAVTYAKITLSSSETSKPLTLGNDYVPLSITLHLAFPSEERGDKIVLSGAQKSPLMNRSFESVLPYLEKFGMDSKCSKRDSKRVWNEF